MEQPEAFPDLKSEHARYESLLWDALARLARQGFAAQPADGADLIQDFYTNIWGGLAERYNPLSGRPANYIYGAFVRFARRRISQSQRWKSRFRDIAAVSDQVVEHSHLSPCDSLVKNEEMESAEAALSEISLERRIVLLDYFALGPRSKRELSRKYGMSRYQVDEILITCFGQLVMRLAVRASWPEPEREVAVSLWCDGRDVEATAAHLRRPPQEVRETRERLKKDLASILKDCRGGLPSALPPGSDSVDSEESQVPSPLCRKD
jgi:RNA polymerase sigma factor (sigma-70 family)